MMRTLLLLAFLFLNVFAYAQDLKIPKAYYPVLPKLGNTVDDFIPKGWEIEIQAKDDLNNDGLEDIVFLLHENNPKNIVKKSDSGEDSLNTNPRILAVIFAEKNGKYSLAMSNHVFIPRYTNPLLSDYIESDSISAGKGIFQLKFGFPLIGAYVANYNFTFRWQNNRFELIGYDSTETKRVNGDIKTISINYSTRKVKVTCSNAQSDDIGKVIWQKLPSNQVWSIDTIGNGIEFDPDIDVICPET
jgi:hypothetical protein